MIVESSKAISKPFLNKTHKLLYGEKAKTHKLLYGEKAKTHKLLYGEKAKIGLFQKSNLKERFHSIQNWIKKCLTL